MCEIISAATMASTFGSGAAALTVLDVVGAVGTLATISGSYTASQTQRDQLNYQAAVDRNNAIIRDRQAQDVIERGEQKARDRKLLTKAQESRALVTVAGQGGDVTAPGEVNLLAEIPERGKLDEERIRNNAAREASAILADSSNMRANAAAREASAEAINPLFSATTTALQSGGAVGAKWYERGTW
tara:strand:+ start:1023 stop:1583 length:561 start_codon:yes stop_codon:yes gene_type:complete